MWGARVAAALAALVVGVGASAPVAFVNGQYFVLAAKPPTGGVLLVREAPAPPHPHARLCKPWAGPFAAGPLPPLEPPPVLTHPVDRGTQCMAAGM